MDGQANGNPPPGAVGVEQQSQLLGEQLGKLAQAQIGLLYDHNRDGLINGGDAPAGDTESNYHRANVDFQALTDGIITQMRGLLTYFDADHDGFLNTTNERDAFGKHIESVLPQLSVPYDPSVSGQLTTESMLQAFSDKIGHGLPEGTMPAVTPRQR